jgi:hypothetical protein
MNWKTCLNMIREYKKMNLEEKKKQGDSNPNVRLVRIQK